MNVTLTSLEALILKATNEILSCPDSAALEAFCTVMKSSPDGPQLASHALAARIHSSNPKEALLALMMLDQCLKRGNPDFLSEIGKFRFLNEMIKLVSPKFFANRTPTEVKSKVVQLFYAWSIEYSKEPKFKVAYDMLKNQGVVKDTPPPMPPEDVPKPRAHSAVFEDEEKSKLLQKLLQSKKPEDLQHANRLIKTMVKEDERRSFASSRRTQEVCSALDSAGLLREMLAHAQDASRDDIQLIHELHAACARARPRLHDLAADEEQGTYLDNVLHAIDVLDEVFELYTSFIVEQKKCLMSPTTSRSAANGEALLDFAGVPPTPPAPAPAAALADLGDIFTAEPTQPAVQPLKPVNLSTNDDVDLLGEETAKREVGWNELDNLGQQLMKQSLPDHARRLDGFTSKNLKKVPMNALEKLSPNNDVQNKTDSILDLDFFTQKPSTAKVTATPHTDSTDDEIVDISTTSTKNKPCDSIMKLKTSVDCDIGSKVDSKLEKEETKKRDVTNPLLGIEVSLTSVKPSKIPPKTIFEEEDGLSVVIHFCQDRPKPYVYVLVVSTTSKKTLPIEDYKFQAIVPKSCKVRLLSPSGSSLPAYNPFLPPPALTQVALLWRVPPAQPTIKYLLTYTCDGDTCSEIGEAGVLPLDDI